MVSCKHRRLSHTSTSDASPPPSPLRKEHTLLRADVLCLREVAARPAESSGLPHADVGLGALGDSAIQVSLPCLLTVAT